MAEIILDQKHWDWQCIDTESFLASTLGEELELPDSIDPDVWDTEQEDELLEFFQSLTDKEYTLATRDNTYNNQNDLSQECIYAIYTPSDSPDWLFAADSFIVVQVHQGGDVRGNYGRLRIYRSDFLGDSEFFGWSIGWHVEPISERYNHSLDYINDQLSPGYSQNPSYHLVSNFIQCEPVFSKKLNSYVVKLQDIAFPCKLSPYSYA